MGLKQNAGRMYWARIPLPNLIGMAYDVRLDQITGPDWLQSEFYAVEATFPPGSTNEQHARMMANLLAERFGLLAHRVTKSVDGYELTVAPGGIKLAASPGTGDGPEKRPEPKEDANGFLVLPPGGPTWEARVDRETGIERMTFRRSSTAYLASTLRMAISRLGNGPTTPITDKTGIGGRFDFELTFPAPGFPARLGGAGQDATGIPGDPDRGPAAISAALEKQIGLKLLRVKVPLDFIVVDHVEKVPTAN